MNKGLANGQPLFLLAGPRIGYADFLWSVVGIILVNAATYSPNGKKDGIQVIPLSEVAAKDEFLNIKNVSCDNMLVVNLMPP
ncbi:hypothetical protein HH682_10240 [Rosenbergiella sp. S61]|uniref:Uncharacterized protein n=1 Tax=Rosenbergiella gaditana TaxID=2726987 RepID=A0ABS5SXH5_9GAMM|nr:hypothetical protein [Rosenbergiella gaditana]